MRTAIVLCLALVAACEPASDGPDPDEPTDCGVAPTLGAAACVLRACGQLDATAAECEAALAAACDGVDVDAARELADDEPSCE